MWRCTILCPSNSSKLIVSSTTITSQMSQCWDYLFVYHIQIIPPSILCLKKNGPIMVPFPIKPTHTVMSLCRSSFRTYSKSKGCSPLGQYSRILCVFTDALSEKPDSSPMIKSSRKSNRSFLSRSHRQNLIRRGDHQEEADAVLSFDKGENVNLGELYD